MKIKLQDYCLVSNDFIKALNDYGIPKHFIETIPVEKLAEHSIEYGAEVLYQTLDPNTGSDKGFKELKQKYFNSEIEIQ